MDEISVLFVLLFIFLVITYQFNTFVAVESYENKRKYAIGSFFANLFSIIFAVYCVSNFTLSGCLIGFLIFQNTTCTLFVLNFIYDVYLMYLDLDKFQKNVANDITTVTDENIFSKEEKIDKYLFSLFVRGDKKYISFRGGTLAKLLHFLTSKIEGFEPLSVDIFNKELPCGKKHLFTEVELGVDKIVCIKDANKLEFNFPLVHGSYVKGKSLSVDATAVFEEYPYLLKYFLEDK